MTKVEIGVPVQLICMQTMPKAVCKKYAEGKYKSNRHSLYYQACKAFI
jgi:hypothetical protein